MCSHQEVAKLDEFVNIITEDTLLQTIFLFGTKRDAASGSEGGVLLCALPPDYPSVLVSLRLPPLYMKGISESVIHN